MVLTERGQHVPGKDLSQFRAIGSQAAKTETMEDAPLMMIINATDTHIMILYFLAKSRYRRNVAMLSLAKNMASRFMTSPYQMYRIACTLAAGVKVGSRKCFPRPYTADLLLDANAATSETLKLLS